jgi:nitrogen fixation NifU-like protein
MSTLYQAELLDHYRNPRHRGELPVADFASQQLNPSCGDMVSFQGRVTDGTLSAVAFKGVGCVISQATASLLSERVVGLSLNSIMAYDKDFILNLIGMELGPTRLKCALLPLEALQQGIYQYQEKKGDHA